MTEQTNHSPSNLGNKRPQLWALLGVFLLVMLPLALTLSQLQRNTLFPADEDRFDVENLWVAKAHNLCPQLDEKPSVEQLEACLSHLSLDPSTMSSELYPFTIPPLPRMPINTWPSLQDICRQMGYSKILDAIRARELILLGFRLPRKLFLENRMGIRPNALVVAQLADTRICYAGRCPQYADINNYHALQFPLLIPNQQALPDQVDMWMFLFPTRFGTTINLEHALFVAAGDKMRGATLIHRGLVLSTWMIEAALLLGVVAMAVLYAMLWAEYIDFAAFATLAGVLLLAALQGFIGEYLSKIFGTLVIRGALEHMINAQIVIASLFFGFSTLRPSPGRFWLTWIGCALATAVGLMTMQMVRPFNRQEEDIISLAFSGCRLVVPSLIVVLGGISIKRRLSRDRDPTYDAIAAGTRRLREQYAMGLCLLGAGIPDLVAAIFQNYGNYTYNIRGLNSIVLLPVFAALLYGAGGKFRSRAEQFRRDIIAMTKKAAIGEMAQMLAHDVRKPFSMLRIGLDMLSGASNYDEMRSVVATLVSQVNRSIRAVGGMVEDIMAVSSEPMMTKEIIAVDLLISQCLNDAFGGRQASDVNLSYKLDPNVAMIEVDSLKILRVIINLVENALDATRSKCSIWFHTRSLELESGPGIELLVGNSDSYIEPERCERIFEAFYTHGKAGGVGLGLAVARKFIGLHEGVIHCRSDRTRGTEFIITLPVGKGANAPAGSGISVDLPNHSRNILDPLKSARRSTQELHETPLSSEESTLREQIKSDVLRIQRPLRVLLVDDEPIYTEALAALLSCLQNSNDSSATLIEIARVTNVGAALKWIESGAADLGIFDVDLGDPTTDGLQLMNGLLARGELRNACVHSNRSLPIDFKRAIAAGAHSVIPKPMNRTNLLKLLAQSASTTPTLSTAKSPANSQARELDTPFANLVIVVDDDPFFREAWETMLTPGTCLSFASAPDLMAWINNHHEQLNQVLCFVLDYYLEDQIDGIELAKMLRANHQHPILLATDAPTAGLDLHDFTAVISKRPTSPDELREIISAEQSSKLTHAS